MFQNFALFLSEIEINWSAASVIVAAAVFLWVEKGKMRERKAASVLAGILILKDLREVAETASLLQRAADPGGTSDFRTPQPVLEKEQIQFAIDSIDGLKFSVMGRHLSDLVTLPATVSQPAARCVLAVSEARSELASFLQKRYPVDRPATRSELGRARGCLMSAEIGAKMAIEAAESIDVFMGQTRLELKRKYRRLAHRIITRWRIWVARDQE